jgi:hypothetical protein
MIDPATREGVETRHRKELKALEGEKRAALKKAKATKGKNKAKDEIVAYVWVGGRALEATIEGRWVLARMVLCEHEAFRGYSSRLFIMFTCLQSISLEADFDRKLREMMERHEVELRELMTAEEEGVDTADDAAAAAAALSESVGPTRKEAIDDERASGAPPQNKDDNDAELERQRRVEKARKKKEKAREKERERERQIADELANAGPSARDLENEIILNQLRPLNLHIREVPADGHCLYRAVAAHYAGAGYCEMRT